MKTLESENMELQSINDDLLRELELRDVAVKEAVALICELEAKIEGAELRQLTADHGLGSTSTRIQSPNSRDSLRTPPPPQELEDQLSPLRRSQRADSFVDAKPKVLGRAPSFLRDQKPSTSALRSVYQAEGSTSFISLNRAGSPVRTDDPDTYTLNSPRLSILSEGDFASVYGKSPKLPLGLSEDSDAVLSSYGAARESIDGSVVSEIKLDRRRTTKPSAIHHFDYSPDNRSDRSRRGMKSVDMKKSRRDASSESTSNRSFEDGLKHVSAHQRSTSSMSRNHETSIWLDQSTSADATSPLQQREQRRNHARSSRKSSSPEPDTTFSSIGEVLHKSPTHKLDKIPPLPSLGGPTFGGPEILPPTPDTMSTQKEANSSNQSIVTEKSLRELTRFPAKNLSAMIPDNDRPHTAGTSSIDFANLDHYNDNDEQHSEYAQQSEAHTDAFIKESLEPSFPFLARGSSVKARQVMGTDAPTRPPLTTYATNLMFDGDGIDDVQPSRGMSYPSPTNESRRRSTAFSPLRPEHHRTASVQTQAMHGRSGSTATSKQIPITTNQKSSPLKPSNSTTHTKSSASSITQSITSATAAAAGDSKLPPRRFGLESIRNSFRRSSSYSSKTPAAAAEGEGSGDGSATLQPSRIARPGTSGSGGGSLKGGLGVGVGLGEKEKGGMGLGGMGRGLGGIGVGRSTSLRLKEPWGRGRREG